MAVRVMKFVQIPNINDAWDKVEMKTLSPSVFSKISKGCKYQALLQKALQAINNRACSLPSPKNAILGTIIHKIYELTSNGELETYQDMTSKWEELIQKQVKTLTDRYPTLNTLDINDYDKRNKAIRYALTLSRVGTSQSYDSGNVAISSEKRLDCSDIGLLGSVDKLVVDNGEIDIIDYKSGAVTDDCGNIKEDYIIQLHLYAAMCCHKRLGSIRSLKLIDINGTILNVPYDPNLSNQLLGKVKDQLSILQSALTTRDFSGLVESDNDTCSLCSCRHICDYQVSSNDATYRTISGYVESSPNPNIYIIRNGASRYCISGIEQYEIDNPDYYIGKRLVFVNISRASSVADDYTFKITGNTLVYELL